MQMNTRWKTRGSRSNSETRSRWRTSTFAKRIYTHGFIHTLVAAEQYRFVRKTFDNRFPSFSPCTSVFPSCRNGSKRKFRLPSESTAVCAWIAQRRLRTNGYPKYFSRCDGKQNAKSVATSRCSRRLTETSTNDIVTYRSVPQKKKKKKCGKRIPCTHIIVYQTSTNAGDFGPFAHGVNKWTYLPIFVRNGRQSLRKPKPYEYRRVEIKGERERINGNVAIA